MSRSGKWITAAVIFLIFGINAFFVLKKGDVFVDVSEIDVLILPVNSDTGTYLDSVSQWSNDTETYFSKVDVTVVDHSDEKGRGFGFSVKGKLRKPFQITIRSDGFHDKRVMIDPDTESPLYLEMSPE